MDTGDLWSGRKEYHHHNKNTAVHRHHPDGITPSINVIDTQGTRTGGEVERRLSMVDGVLLLVGASEVIAADAVLFCGAGRPFAGDFW